MTTLPITTDVLVLRTDFSDDHVWEHICTEIRTPNSEFGFIANVDFCSDIQFKDLQLDHLPAVLPESYPHWIIFIVDSMAVSNAEHPVLCVDLMQPANAPFRVIPSEMWGVENNITIANIDFSEFSEGLDSDGIFRGFQ